MNPKKIIRQYRRPRRDETKLIHYLINAKSWHGSYYKQSSKEIVKMLLNTAYEWESFKKDSFLRRYSISAIEPQKWLPSKGEKTYLHNGRYYSEEQMIQMGEITPF